MNQGSASIPAYFNTTHKLPLDVSEQLFYPTFLQTEFLAWLDPRKSWQLHIHGGPGRGKSTLAAVFSRYLREYTKLPVATLYIEQITQTSGLGICAEDVMHMVTGQLLPAIPSPRPQVPQRDSNENSLQPLQDALTHLSSQSSIAFIIIDGLDYLPSPVQSSLETLLQGLHNVKILATRRSPFLDSRSECFWACDSCTEGDVIDPLNLYWECELCASLSDQIPDYAEPQTRWNLCYECHNKGIVCPVQGHENSLIEPYRYVNLLVRTLSLSELIKQDLYLQTGVSTAANAVDQDEIYSPIQNIMYGNINHAKLRLDHDRELLSMQNDKNDRLPSTIVAYFDTELERIEPNDPSLRALVMIALAATVPRDHLPPNDDDSNIDEIEEVLARCDGAVTDTDMTSQWPNLMRALRAARGLIYLADRDVHCYDVDFAKYVAEDCSRDLIEAYQQLDVIQKAIAAECSEADAMFAESETTANLDIAGDYRPYHSSLNAQFSSLDDGLYLPGNENFTSTSSPPPTISRGTSADSDNSASISISSVFSRTSTISSVSPPDEVDDFVEDKTPSNTLESEEISRSKTICTYCTENILESNSLQGLHRKDSIQSTSYTSSQCLFCSTIYESESIDPAGKQEENASSIPTICNWSLRTRGRISNHGDTHSIIFQESSSQAPAKRFHMLMEQDVCRVARVDDLGNSTHPRNTGEQIRTWISACDHTHPYCVQIDPEPYTPKRLVDIDTGSRDMIRVVNTAKHGIRGPYATLSHCWGKTRFLVLLPDNEALLMGKGISTSELALNFRESIEVARSIGMKYIWIDSLCIMQGPRGDFVEQGQFMHKVYRSSYCNIVAADSADSEGGLFRERNPSDIVPATYEADDESRFEKGTWRILDENLWNKELLGSPIYTRAWVFQERMLSPRLLHFTKSQIFWDCSTLSACEAIPKGLPHAVDRHAVVDRHWRGRLNETVDDPNSPPLIGPNADSLENFWKTALLRYTKCNLTDQKDKRVAIWSVAKLVRDALQRKGPGEEYGGGLWARNLHEQLAWRAASPFKNARLDKLQSGSPSWSWASVKGPIHVQDRLVNERDYVVESHQGEHIAFRVKTGSRDKEPELQGTGSIDMNCYLGRSAIVKNNSFLTHRLTLGEEVSDTIHVFLDETPELENLQSMECHFVILAASLDRHHKITQTSYSGIGLVLVSLDAYKMQQQAKLTALETLRAEGQRTGVVDEELDNWYEACSVWNQELLARCESLDVSEPHFRRIGALQFSGMSANTWAQISDPGRSKFWLD
ncbi:unnamed protein product [Periconia digitata]|uniref:Heterokaryon incompatibility domain-containing protein n=1 Tax=Periconia digitata TaxID=1303443 RepID=A0A9W4UED4_9PLEO|nr:unnamed protein product [Periconia digitata]